MISILANGPADAEFFSSQRRSSIFDNVTNSRRVKPTYGADGRVFVNEKPLILEPPNDMWKNLLVKARSMSALNATLKTTGFGENTEDEQSKPRPASAAAFSNI